MTDREHYTHSSTSDVKKLWDTMDKYKKAHILATAGALTAHGTLSSSALDSYKSLSKVFDSTDEAMCMAIYMNYDCLDLLGIIPSSMFCYKPNKSPVIRLLSIVKESSKIKKERTGTVVLYGEMEGFTASTDRKYIVKWFRGEKSIHSCEHEIGIYTAIYNISRTSLPWFSSSYRLWSDPVLVVEMLSPLDDDDNEVEVGIDILTHLKTIHQVCLHCDIKKDNIMKDVTGTSTCYYLIDFGQSTLISEGKKNGTYPRHVYTRGHYRDGWRSRTSIKTELIELFYVLEVLYQNRIGASTKTPPHLRAYKSVLMNEDEDPNTRTIYDRLITALKK